MPIIGKDTVFSPVQLRGLLASGHDSLPDPLETIMPDEPIIREKAREAIPRGGTPTASFSLIQASKRLASLAGSLVDIAVAALG